MPWDGEPGGLVLLESDRDSEFQRYQLQWFGPHNFDFLGAFEEILGKLVADFDMVAVGWGELDKRPGSAFLIPWPTEVCNRRSAKEAKMLTFALCTQAIGGSPCTSRLICLCSCDLQHVSRHFYTFKP